MAKINKNNSSDEKNISQKPMMINVSGWLNGDIKKPNLDGSFQTLTQYLHNEITDDLWYKVWVLKNFLNDNEIEHAKDQANNVFETINKIAALFNENYSIREQRLEEQEDEENENLIQ